MLASSSMVEAGRLQKKKHQVSIDCYYIHNVQITWLATTAAEDEAKIAERASKMRDAKRKTRAKYGW